MISTYLRQAAHPRTLGGAVGAGLLAMTLVAVAFGTVAGIALAAFSRLLL